MSNYSNITSIRREAGFASNTNIVDATVTAFMGAATSHIDSIISKVYSLPLASTPDILELIERRLAAGYLLLEEYGEQAEGTDKDGQEKVDWAEDELEKILKGEVKLLDTSQEQLTTSSEIKMGGFPDSTAGTDKTTQGDKDDPPVFEVGQEF